MNQPLSASYDEKPYPSYNYQKTRPDNLACVGRLFGMEPPDFRRARVLELGCASGGNLLPMAAIYPDSTFVGIDFSGQQIDAARQAIDELNLDNITFEMTSLMDINAAFGKFDFIIAHGLYSWVAGEVQNKIIEICKKNLTGSGIAYVSYNTLPGWNILKSIRNMIMYHTADIEGAAKKIVEARRLLNFTLENLSGGETPYKQILKTEIDIISKSDDNYFFYDYLEQCNEPCYFNEFMAKARAQGLQYLGDADVPTMYSGNFTQAAHDTLGQIPDLIRQEQYLDFLSDRRFRSTLLCHSDIRLSRDISAERLAGYFWTTGLSHKDGFSSVELSADNPVVFDCLQRGNSVTSTTRAGSAAICVLGENSARPLPVDMVVDGAVARLGDVSRDVVRKTFLDFVGQLLLNGSVDMYLDPGSHVTEVSDRPEVWLVARHKSRSAGFVPNLLHQGITLEEGSRLLLQYVDGTRTVEEISDAYVKHFSNGDLSYLKEGLAVTDEDIIRRNISPIVRNGLRLFAANGLLVA
jgi:methyltransferase-like protein/2-polyprenyl-3-methyl-5-hydroxy-6-metoxy-1,4-benzoquinol methylase